MSVAFFDDCLLKAGMVTSGDLPTIAFTLDMAEVKVTVEELQPHVASMHPNGECALTGADMEQLLTWLPETVSFLSYSVFLEQVLVPS